MDSCKQRHDREGWRGCQRYPVGRAKRGVRFLAVGSDLGFLRAGAAAALKVLKG